MAGEFSLVAIVADVKCMARLDGSSKDWISDETCE